MRKGRQPKSVADSNAAQVIGSNQIPGEEPDSTRFAFQDFSMESEGIGGSTYLLTHRQLNRFFADFKQVEVR